MDTPRNRRAWIGPWLIGLGVTTVLMIATDLALQSIDVWWAGFIPLFATSLWVAADSTVIGIQRYRTELANDPVILGAMCAVLWIPVFPWYLIVRQGVRRGLVPLKRHAAGATHR